MDELIGAQVELSAPDGRVFHFHVKFLAPYAGETYAVLEHDDDGQLLVTTVEPADDGQVAFTVVGEDDIISAVLEKLAAYSVAMALEGESAQDEEGCGCGCGHHHHENDCCCGHDHSHDHDAHGHPLPSYIKRA